MQHTDDHFVLNISDDSSSHKSEELPSSWGKGEHANAEKETATDKNAATAETNLDDDGF